MLCPVLAHGFGDVGDLPVTLPLLLFLAGGLVVAVAGALSARAARPSRLWSVPLPSWVTALADHPVTRGTARALAGLLLLTAALTAALGADDVLRNPAPALFYTVLWAGVLLVVSLLLGPVWPVLNPLRSVTAALARLSGDPGERSVRPVPPALGVWPAAGAFAAFVWVEALWDRQPASVLAFLVVYALVEAGAAASFGRAWYRHGDGFEVYSRLLGSLAPLGRGPDGRLTLRSPRRALAATASEPGLLAVLAVLLGAHAFDSLADTLFWQQTLFGGPRLLLQTAGLAACVAAVAAVVAVATRPTFLRPALVPVVAAYAIAHYFGPLLVETQHALVTLSDPLARGSDLLGLSGRRVTYEAVSPALAAVAQIVAFVGFHLLAVAAAHDRATARFDPRTARAVQFPFRALLLVSVLAGLVVRFGGA